MEVRQIPGRGALRPIVMDRMRRYTIENIISLHDALYSGCLDSGAQDVYS
jgi:hypothetical protein